MGETLIKLLDYIIENGSALLGYLGGGTGIVAGAWVIVKYLTPILVARANKKNGVNTNIKALEQKVNALEDTIKKLPDVFRSILNEQQMAKYDKIKNILNIDEIVEKKEQIEEIVEQIQEQVEEQTDIVKAKVVVRDE